MAPSDAHEKRAKNATKNLCKLARMSGPFVNFKLAHLAFPRRLQAWQRCMGSSEVFLAATASHRSVRPRRNHIERHGEYYVDEYQ